MPIKVLIVDDSFVMRKLLRDILSSEDIEVVGVAKSGSEAMKIIPQIKPDVITLDLVMPAWDGLTTLKHIMEEYPTPVIILSAHSREGADITIECLAAGAVSFILKPSGELSLDIEKVAPELLEGVRMASKIDVAKISALFVPEGFRVKYKAVETDKIIVIGASTGGPQTLTAILSSLPRDFSPSIIIVQHMPSIEFTQSLAERFKRVCKLMVKVAEDNETIARKKIYLVPGGYSMTLQTIDRENKTKVVIRLVKDKPDALTPSINATMRSAAEIFNGNAIGVVLTGMGSDGAEGMEAIKNSGGKTLVQDESSLIFGMPKAVIDRGCADSVLPAGKIAEKIIELVSSAY
jgi:two-component system chemotaxis response regulator CheB